MEMLDGVAKLTLDFLNEATQAWVEVEYNRLLHRETRQSPVERFAQAPDVLRASPCSKTLRQAFRLQTQRRQRHSDGTISLAGVRFEVPARYRHFRDLVVRYARWDLSRVDLVDPLHGTILCALYPLDRRANADGQRLLFEIDSPVDDRPPSDQKRPDDPPSDPRRPDQELPPLLQRILSEYSATGMPPAYLPKQPRPKQEGEPS